MEFPGYLSPSLLAQQKCRLSYHPEAIKFPHKESQCYFINLIEEKIGLPNLQTDKIAQHRTGQKGGCIVIQWISQWVPREIH